MREGRGPETEPPIRKSRYFPLDQLIGSSQVIIYKRLVLHCQSTPYL